MKIRFISVIFTLLLPLYAIPQDNPKGSLVIVGGGLEHDNKSVFGQLIALAGGADKATFAIIPSASGVSVQSYMSFRNILRSYGVLPDHIHLIDIAMVDDDSTKDVDESAWRDHGNDIRLAKMVRSCSAVWFTGGDQSRTMKTLLRPDGGMTPVLEAVWDVYRAGGVIGGSSAGAAIMSETMIGGGSSMGALLHGVVTNYQGADFPDSLGVWLTQGLGFFPAGIVDQHFEARSRIGRLSVALLNKKPQVELGFGIDENTAVIYHGKKKTLTIAGVSGVTILNATDARISKVQGLPKIENLSLSYLMEGDSYDVETGNIAPANGKKPIGGSERFTGSAIVQPGILSGACASFREMATTHLVDNTSLDTVSNVSFFDKRSGFMATLSKTPRSGGFYDGQKSGNSRYTLMGLRLDLIPVHIDIAPMK